MRCRHGLLPVGCGQCGGVATPALDLPSRSVGSLVVADCGDAGAIVQADGTAALRAEIDRLRAENAMLALEAATVQSKPRQPRAPRQQQRDYWGASHDDRRIRGDVLAVWTLYRTPTTYQGAECGHTDSCVDANDRLARLNSKQRRSEIRRMVYPQNKHVGGTI